MKQKTPIASAIAELDSIIYMFENTPDEMDFEHTLKTFRESLVNRLPKEKKITINSYKDGTIGHLLPETYFNEYFEQ